MIVPRSYKTTFQWGRTRRGRALNSEKFVQYTTIQHSPPLVNIDVGQCQSFYFHLFLFTGIFIFSLSISRYNPLSSFILFFIYFSFNFINKTRKQIHVIIQIHLDLSVFNQGNQTKYIFVGFYRRRYHHHHHRPIDTKV